MATTDDSPHSAFEQEVLELTNELRAEEGLDPLRLDADLAEVADDHSADMADNNFVSHTGSDGRSYSDRVTDADYDWMTVGENIAAGYATPEEVVAGWFDSPGHRANMLNPNFVELGVGYVQEDDSSYGSYWTQVFATSSDDFVA